MAAQIFERTPMPRHRIGVQGDPLLQAARRVQAVTANVVARASRGEDPRELVDMGSLAALRHQIERLEQELGR